ncbi:hypothetical protein TPDSL_07540 [Terrisporobacter petrolearius]|uniref:hypothetical protein n=1 Tax=Terrisporobacter petrolearius TaxID=1460447 RepID=UPI003366F99F
MSIDINETVSGKYWIRKIIKENNGSVLNERIINRDTRIESINWLSPLENENFREYMLNSPSLIEKLNNNGFTLKKEDLSFWPQREPVWDGIGLATVKDSQEKMIVLVENKSSIKELRSKLASTNENNKRLILDSMKETYDELGIKGDFNKWFDTYYQIANRFTFMHQLMKKGYRVKLVFLNIVDDHMYKNISKAQWVEEYCKMLNEFMGERFVPRDVVIIDLNVHEEK